MRPDLSIKESTQPMVVIKAVIFDYGSTLSSEPYFQLPHARIAQWHVLIQDAIFGDERICQSGMTGKMGLRDVAEIIRSGFGTPEDTPSSISMTRGLPGKLGASDSPMEISRQLLTMHRCLVAGLTGRIQQNQDVSLERQDSLAVELLNAQGTQDADADAQRFLPYISLTGLSPSLRSVQDVV